MRRVLLVMLACAWACSASDVTDVKPLERSGTEGSGDAKASVDETEIVRGVVSNGRDPAVVALRIGGQALCTGALVAKDVVLTARHCVSKSASAVACPPDGVQVYGDRPASSIEVLLGDQVDGQDAAARGREIVSPNGVTLCDADIALVVLDRPIKNVRPLGVRTTGVAKGDRVRAVGFGKRGDDLGAGVKLVREHVPVLAVRAAEFTVGEATCQGDSGGPALDEATGEIVGVVSRGGPSCEGAGVHNIYTRADTFGWLVDAALARSGLSEVPDGGDAGPKGAPRAGKDKPPSDVGSACAAASDCAAGVCVREADKAYCSRACGNGDRCPTRFHCQKVEGASVCVQVR